MGHYPSYQAWWRNSLLFSFFQICVKASIASVSGNRFQLLNLGIWHVLSTAEKLIYAVGSPHNIQGCKNFRVQHEVIIVNVI